MNNSIKSGFLILSGTIGIVGIIIAAMISPATSWVTPPGRMIVSILDNGLLIHFISYTFFMGYIYVTEKRKIKQKYINYGGVYMHIFKKIFTILAIIFGSLGLMNIVSTDVALPLMYFFMGLTLLTTAKEFYDKNKKKDAIISIVAAILVYTATILKVFA